jgi:P27 family predicted phage terminase small subunit
MGKRGPPPKPSEVKKLEGTYRKDRVARNEFKPTPGTPDRPADLDPVACAEWDRVVPELIKAGLLTMVDGAVLEGYCATFAMARHFQKLAEQAPIVDTDYGLKPHPAVSEARRSWALVRQLAAEFGFTPSSRTRVGSLVGGDGKDEAAEFLFGQLRVVDGGTK